MDTTMISYPKEPQGPSRTTMNIASSRHPKIDTLDVSVCDEIRYIEGQSTSNTHTDRPKELWFDPWLAAKGDTLREAVQNRRTSTIAATEWFVRLMAEKGVSEADFGRHKGQELIVLTETEGLQARRGGQLRASQEEHLGELSGH